MVIGVTRGRPELHTDLHIQITDAVLWFNPHPASVQQVTGLVFGLFQKGAKTVRLWPAEPPQFNQSLPPLPPHARHALWPIYLAILLVYCS